MPKTGRVYLNQSVSFPPDMLTAAKKRARNLGLSFSTYVQKCLEKDLETREAIVFEERTGGYDEAAEKAGKRRPARGTDPKG